MIVHGNKARKVLRGQNKISTKLTKYNNIIYKLTNKLLKVNDLKHCFLTLDK